MNSRNNKMRLPDLGDRDVCLDIRMETNPYLLIRKNLAEKPITRHSVCWSTSTKANTNGRNELWQVYKDISGSFI